MKGGAGQYFTPQAAHQGHGGGDAAPARRDHLRSGLRHRRLPPGCPRLSSERKIFDLDKEQKQFLKLHTFRGKDVVDGVVRLCAMNLYLHGIGGEESPIEVGDSLHLRPGAIATIWCSPIRLSARRAASPSSTARAKADRETLTYSRQDFWATTSNKQLNFLQHVRTLLKINGRAAIVVPDNVLFEGGAGETVRRKLLQDCDVHTLLRLPTGVFYAQGVKANVLFFDRKPASETPWTEKLWIYDLRTNQHFTLKTNPLKLEDLQDFIKCYNPENRHDRLETERFRAFSYEELVKRDKASLDIFWLKDESLEDSDNLPEPAILAREIVESLETALEQFRGIEDELKD